MRQTLVTEGLKALVKIILGVLGFKLFKKVMDNNYSVSASHRGSSISMSPQGKS